MHFIDRVSKQQVELSPHNSDPVDHFSTRLNARVQERKGEVIQGLCRLQAIHFLKQNFTLTVMAAYLGCHSEIRALNVLETVAAVYDRNSHLVVVMS
jgi:hypothetical protein